ncbi:MAG: DNA mismatch repair endonuclease MutL [Candidatus Aminicenantes bacterium]|nr:MAG: DNA mismatch repair endonuclease MutL [Candidatus Aminicenantes bacterium]
MKKIILLPSKIAQKIAAGEVIERPFSVVKELVENSLDAGSTEIKVEVIEGGKRLIRVSDNGQGMSREDASISFERHSTSKLKQEEDLDKISTMGFRGEALPSISAVSRVSLKTSDGIGEKGTQVVREGEEMLRCEDVAFPRGTSIEVKDLFFNLPARQKFLRSDRAELSQIVRYITHIALAFPEVRFSVQHGNRRVFDYPAVTSIKERLYQVYGKSVLERLMAVDHEEDGRGILGFVSRPPSGRKDRSHQLFYVNNRLVKDRMLQAALNQGFRGYLEKDRFAEAFLFLTLPYPEVDVNVHPTKAEVRFKESQPIFYLIQAGIAKAITKELGIKEVYPAQPEIRESRRIDEKYQPSLMAFPDNVDVRMEKSFKREIKREPGYPRVLGQYLDTYIVATAEDGVLIIDQHNAHERVLYERYMEIDQKEGWPRKMSLLPMVFDLSASQVLNFEHNRALLEEVGFLVENMGGRSFALKEYPDIFKEEEAKQIFLSLLEGIKEEKVLDKKGSMIATLACKSAVKAGQPLVFEKMNYLVEELFQTTNPSLCPHGRPIILKIGRGQIEKEIKRK